MDWRLIIPVSATAMMVRILFLAVLLPVALAYSNTHPVIAWASHTSPSLDVRTSGDILESILSSDDVCNHDAIVLVEQPGLHASDLRSLPPNSALTSSLLAAPSSLQLPYVPINRNQALSDFAKVVARRCGSKVVHAIPGDLSDSVTQDGEKHIVCMNMPSLIGENSQRKNMLSDSEAQLSSDLEVLSFIFPKHLVIYAGGPYAPAIYSRQDPGSAPHNGTALPEGGILKRYQLLTPGLIVSLIIVFFVLVPAILAGVNALASIKNPVRTESPQFNAVEKKNQ